MNLWNHLSRFVQSVESRPQWLGAVLLSVVACILFMKGIHHYKEQLGYNMETKTVLTSTREMPQGHVIHQEDLEIVALPQKYLPVGVLFENDAPKVDGRMVIRPIARGELILWSAVDVGLASIGPATRVAKGYRAISIAVDSTTSVGQSVRPGDHVDLIMTSGAGNEDVSSTFTLLQNVAVLDVGNGDVQDNESSQYSTVSLMVLPKEVGIIVHAEQQGKLHLALRNPEDYQTPNDLPMVALHQLIESAYRSSIQQERNSSIEIIRGGQSSFVQ